MHRGTVLIPAPDMQAAFKNILLKKGFQPSTADQLATGFTNNSLDGVYTHGVNRFPRFVEYVEKGFVKTDAAPVQKSKFGGIEQWDGQLGPGITNAIFATERSMELADANGIGCVALSNTNHWMRGGTYGWQAAINGYVFIGWTNTIGNMPAWGAVDARLGNNPLVLGLPFGDDAIVLDMAMSQYSFGAMELAAMKNEKLNVPGGFDSEGNITDDPHAILESRRPVPIGFWKGAGLSLLLDMLAALLSGGLPTADISRREAEYGLSQVFIAIKISVLPDHSSIPALLENIIRDYKLSRTAGTVPVTYPGERVLATRNKNREQGIPVLAEVWESILKLQAR